MISAAAIGIVVFAFVFGGAVLGMLVRRILPEHHLSAESKDVIKLAMGLIGTMVALVLSLLVASAKGSYDTRSTEVTQMSANLVLLDRVLAHYGPETREARQVLRATVARIIDQMWPRPGAGPVRLEPFAGSEALFDRIEALAPQNDTQRFLQNEARRISVAFAQTRWLLVGQQGHSIPRPFLIVLVCWGAIIFGSFGLYAKPNATVIAALLVCALSFSSAIFLIVELDRPFEGWIHIPSASLQEALAHLAQ